MAPVVLDRGRYPQCLVREPLHRCPVSPACRVPTVNTSVRSARRSAPRARSEGIGRCTAASTGSRRPGSAPAAAASPGGGTGGPIAPRGCAPAAASSAGRRPGRPGSPRAAHDPVPGRPECELGDPGPDLIPLDLGQLFVVTNGQFSCEPAPLGLPVRRRSPTSPPNRRCPRQPRRLQRHGVRASAAERPQNTFSKIGRSA